MSSSGKSWRKSRGWGRRIPCFTEYQKEEEETLELSVSLKREAMSEYKHVKNLQKSFWRALLSQDEGKAVQTNFL